MKAESLQALNGASVAQAQDGSIEVRSTAMPWAYALVTGFPGIGRDSSAVGVRASLDIDVQAGTAGVFLVDAEGHGPLGTEVMVDARQGRTTVELDAPAGACQLCVRTGPSGPAVVRICGVRTWTRRLFDVTAIIDGLMPTLLKHPG